MKMVPVYQVFSVRCGKPGNVYTVAQIVGERQVRIIDNSGEEDADG